jgi:hypothetical protein
MTMKLALIATALAGSMLIPAAATAPAEARTVLLQQQGAGPAPGWNGNRGGGWNRGGYHGGYRGGYYGGRRGGYGWGPAAGAFGAGVLLGGALAAPPPVYYEPQPAYDADEAYCVQRFKSYDPASGTYLGYDGQRHACP